MTDIETPSWARPGRPAVRVGDTVWVLNTFRTDDPVPDEPASFYGREGVVSGIDGGDLSMPVCVRLTDGGNSQWLSSWSLTPVVAEPVVEPVEGDVPSWVSPQHPFVKRGDAVHPLSRRSAWRPGDGQDEVFAGMSAVVTVIDDTDPILPIRAQVDGLEYPVWLTAWSLADPAVKTEEYDPAVGDKVRVVEVLPTATPEFREWAIGRMGTVNSGRPEVTVQFAEGYAPINSRFVYAVAKVELVEAVPSRDAEDEPVDTVNYTALLDGLRQTLEQWADDKEWCGEYEESIDRLFGWTSERSHAVDYDVTVSLTREVDIRDITGGDDVFGVSAELTTTYITISGDYTITVAGDSEDGPSRSDVEEALDGEDVTCDSFSIADVSAA